MEAVRGFDGRWDGRAGAVMVVLMSLGAVELIRADSYQIQRCLNTGRYGAARAGRFGLGINCAVPQGTRVLKGTEVRSHVKVEVAVRGSPSLISLMVSVDVKQHERSQT